MLFSALEFLLIFLPVTLLGFYGLARLENATWLRAWLLLCSLFFYAYWNWHYLPLLIGSIAMNYTIGRKLEAGAHKRWLVAGITLNLGLLGYFKYTMFFLGTLNEFGAGLSMPQIILPLAISFFTFQQISYLVDAYRGKTVPHDPVLYALFVSFFPQLIAGPIVHHAEMCHQFNFRGRLSFFNSKLVSAGLVLFIVGLAKKVVIADQIGAYVDPLFATASTLNFWEAWTATIGYTLQLYFDFSGYSEMAMGLGLLFGIRLPKNFDSPYRARNIAEFWRRWHMTLGRFLRDYLYIPLGGSRNGMATQVGALSITMLLGGLWHGAGWTFVLWGGLHGLYLGIYHVCRQLQLPPLPKPLAVITTLFAVMMAWVLFRAENLPDAIAIWSSLSGANGLAIPDAFSLLIPFQTTWIEYIPMTGLLDGTELIAFGFLLILTASLKNIHEYLEGWEPKRDWAIATATTWMAALYFVTDTSYFLYFTF